MTPTLLGRWQTRLLLMGTVGFVLTVMFCLGLFGNPRSSLYLALLIYIVLLGLGWDVLYMFLQKFRWDQDWPAVLQWAAAVWEAFFFLCIRVILGIELPFTAVEEISFPVNWFLIHYFVVWIAVFLCSQSLMRIVYPRWRFNGGQWL